MNQRSGPGIYALQEPLTLPGGLRLPNRVVQAPCTRNRATADLSPSAGAGDYYATRSEAGLLITEATLITPDAQGYLDTPGLFLDSHVAAWSVVTRAVHDRGGRIFAVAYRANFTFALERLPTGVGIGGTGSDPSSTSWSQHAVQRDAPCTQ